MTQIIYNNGEEVLNFPYNCTQLPIRVNDEFVYYPKQGLCISGTIDKISHVFDDRGNNGYTMKIFLK